MKKQLIADQKSEIEFGKKLYLQQVKNKTVFDNEFDGVGIGNIVDDRMKKTHAQTTLL